MPKAYQQSGSYVPRKDADFLAWVKVFAKHVHANPGRYGLGKPDGELLNGLAKDFGKAYDLVQSPETRSPAYIAHKDALRASAAGTFRAYAAQIRANLGVTNEDKIGLGLHIPDPTPTAIAAPETRPMLNIVGAFSGAHVLRYADETTPNARRKPPGVVHMHLAVAISDGIVTNPDEAKFIGNYSTQPIQVHHEPEDSTKTASYFARWVTKRGLMGPWSLPVWMVIAFGGGVQDSAVADGTKRDDGGLKMAA